MASSQDIPKEMEAIVCHGIKDYRFEVVPVPEIGPGEILTKVLAVGICAGDAKCYAGAMLFWGDKDREAYCQPPIIPGHEFICEVVKLDDGVAQKTGLKVGDHCISEQIVPCWECRFCKRGAYHMCVPHNIYGFRQPTPGAMASYMKFPAGSITHKVPKEIPAWQAAYIEPLACSLHAVERGDIQFSHVVVVSGCGPLGLGMVAGAKQKNPSLLIALDMFDWKLDIAKECGADVVLNPSKCNVVEEVQKRTEGYGCDVYIEATGHPSSVKQGLLMIAKLGTFVEYSVFGSETTVDWTIIGDTKELNIHGGHLGPGTYPKAISMLEKKQLPMDGRWRW
eukprot:scpid4315/ scgid1512/ Probable L-threonine 3-dehydrogenase